MNGLRWVLLIVGIAVALTLVGCMNSEAKVPAPIVINNSTEIPDAALLVAKGGFSVDFDRLFHALGGEVRYLGKYKSDAIITYGGTRFRVGLAGGEGEYDVAINGVFMYVNGAPQLPGMTIRQILQEVNPAADIYREGDKVHVELPK